MTDAKLQWRSSLILHGLTFSTGMKFNDYMESIARSAAKMCGSLFRYTFINLPLFRALKITIISDLVSQSRGSQPIAKKGL